MVPNRLPRSCTVHIKDNDRDMYIYVACPTDSIQAKILNIFFSFDESTLNLKKKI